MGDEQPSSGFRLDHERTAISAWGADLSDAFAATLTGMMHAAGAPLGQEPGGKSRTLQAKGDTAAQALDNLARAVWDAIRAGERLDGSLNMGGVVRGDDGWRCWAAFGLADEGVDAIRPFEVLKEPHVERKPGRVIVKAQFLVWTNEMENLMTRLDEIMPLHPGGVIGPAIE